ncbi:MAG: type II toxin-antitoxin system VapC family toxin [Candidatus Moraniibacteriota bacterium]
MKDYIVDASVVLNMILKEDLQTAAIFQDLIKEAKKNKIKLWSTAFFRHEVANGLRYSNKDRGEVLEIWEYFMKLPIACIDLEKNFLGSVANLSHKLNTSVYDTSYHYLAMVLEGIFLTRDKKYYQKAKELGNIQCF